MKTIQKKICMLGGFAVGKTSLVRRFVDGSFEDKYLSTIGVKISRKNIVLAERHVNMMLWDLAGGDDLLRSNVNYMRGAAGALVVCDLTRLETLEMAASYAHHFIKVNTGASIVLMANKADLVDERVVPDSALQAVVGELPDAAFYLTSAKDGLQVEVAFGRIAEMVVSHGK